MKIVPFKPKPKDEGFVSPEDVFKYALQEGINNVIVAGWLPDGTFYLATSHDNAADHLMKLEIAKQWVIKVEREDD